MRSGWIGLFFKTILVDDVSGSIMDIKKKLKDLTGFPYIYLKSRGNAAIREILRIIAGSGIKKVVIQDQGGWLRYRDYPPKYGLETEEIRTDYGIIDPATLKHLQKDSCLLYQSPAGYFAKQPEKEIYENCSSPVILDITGEIGSQEKYHADYLVCSFGKTKAIDLGYGGFLASKTRLDVDEDFESNYTRSLSEKIEQLKHRMDKLYKISETVKKDLSEYKIIHRNKKGINVAVRFGSEKEKDEIIEYCNVHLLEYTICPRYIRVNEDAVSIEIKRLSF